MITLKRLAITTVLIVFSCSVLWAQQAVQRTWSTTISGHTANPADAVREFALYDVSQEETELRGTWFYNNGTASGQRAHAVVIEGVRTSEGIFWPNVVLQIKNKSTGNWETVAKSATEGARTVVSIEPDAINFDLKVKLDALKPFIGTHEFGRVVLDSGETSEFELKYLSPPKDA